MYEHRELLRASSDLPLDIWFEPWAEGFRLSPGSAAELRAISSHPGKLEIDHQPDHTTVYAWPGSTLKVLVNDVVVHDFTIAVPDVPAGMDVKSFVKTLFGETPPKP
jgi:hypothetical protein